VILTQEYGSQSPCFLALGELAQTFTAWISTSRTGEQILYHVYVIIHALHACFHFGRVEGWHLAHFFPYSSLLPGSRHSLSRQKTRDCSQHLNSAWQGPVGSRPLRSRYTCSTSFLLLKNFVPAFHALQTPLIRPHTGVRQSTFVRTTHKASPSAPFLPRLRGSNRFETSGAFQASQNFRTPSASLGKARRTLPRQLVQRTRVLPLFSRLD